MKEQTLRQLGNGPKVLQPVAEMVLWGVDEKT
jgi:hypothetical protein